MYSNVRVLAKPTAAEPGRKEDPFDAMSWWQANKHKVPSFWRICRAVLTHLPNSCSPEALFSVLNDTFDDDQKSTHADMMELSLQIQFDNRTPRKLSKRKAKVM